MDVAKIRINKLNTKLNPMFFILEIFVLAKSSNRERKKTARMFFNTFGVLQNTFGLMADSFGVLVCQ